MIQIGNDFGYPAYEITTSVTWTGDSSTWVFIAGNVSDEKFGVWSKEVDDLLYDQQAFGL